MAKRSVTDKTIAHPIVKGCIEEQVINLTQKLERIPQGIRNELVGFAKTVAREALSSSSSFPRPNIDQRGWKSKFADDTSRILRPRFQYRILEECDELKRVFPKAIRHEMSHWCLVRITATVSQVARMISLGLSPALLLYNEEEAMQAIFKKAQQTIRRGGSVEIVRALR